MATGGLLLQAAEGSPAWYEVATGIIAIPVTLVGALGSWYLVKKLRLESKKLDLELQEKAAELSDAQRKNDPIAAARVVAGPVLAGRRVQELLLRFVLLYLVLQSWSLAGQLLDGLARSAFGLSALVVFEGEAIGESPRSIAALILFSIVQTLPSIVYWLLWVALGWPLLLDTVRLLSIEVPPILFSRGFQRLLYALAVLGALSSQFVRAAGVSTVGF